MNPHPPLTPLSPDALAFSHVPEWKLRGRCANAGNPDGMFPFEGDREGLRAAKALCHSCPVTTACLEHALTFPEHWGVWGGLGEAERARLRRRQQDGGAA